MVYLSRFDFDLDPTTAFQLNPDICSISSTAPIPIIPNSSPYNQHPSKDIDLDYLNMNTNRISFTEFLSTDVMDHYGIIHHQTTCSSPESDNYIFMDDTKVKLEEYSEPLDASSIYNMSRTLSSDSCPELANCNQTTSPLTPIDSPSPHDQSPIMTPNCLPMSHHHPQYHHQQMINDEVMIETPPTTATKRGRGRRATTTSNAVMTNTISGMQLQDPQEYQHSIMGSSSLPSPPQKTSGKSRGRRMSNKPAKPGTKSFECTYAGCGRVFKRSEHLKRHIRSIHTLERPFHCPHPHCSKRFSRSDNLSQHVRVHRPNGKEKNATARSFSNFTPFLQTYPNGNLHSALPPH